MRGYADLARVLVVLQAGLGILALLGQLVVNGGNPLYLPVAVAHTALLLACAAAPHRRWAMVTLVVLEGLSVAGFWVSLAVGLLPWVVYPANLVGVLTDLVLPAAVLYLAARLLAARLLGEQPAGGPQPGRAPA
jgi:hypothetical protein